MRKRPLILSSLLACPAGKLSYDQKTGGFHMSHSFGRAFSPLAAPMCVALGLQACGISTSTVNLTSDPEPVELTMTPAIAQSGASVQLKVVSPASDSIAIESVDGLDRYWGSGSTLTA